MSEPTSTPGGGRTPDRRSRLFGLVDRLGVNRLAFDRTRSALRILCYHGAWTVSRKHFGNKIFIGMHSFSERLAALAQARCNVLPLLEAVEALQAGTLPPRAVAITIDDGWASTFEFMLPELRRHGFPATVYLQTERLVTGAPVHDVAISFAIAETSVPAVTLSPEFLQGIPDNPVHARSFALTDQAGRQGLGVVLNAIFDAAPLEQRRGLLYRLFDLLGIRSDDLERARTFHLGTPDEVRVAAGQGFEIALHTHTHTLGDFSPAVIAAEIGANRDTLGTILDRPPGTFRHFCWPSGDYTAPAMVHLAGLDVSVATSCDFGLASASSNPLCLPRMLDGELTSTAEFRAMVSGAKAMMLRASS